MIKLLDDINNGFSEMDNELKKMNKSLANNLTQSNVINLVSETIPLLNTQLKEIKLNMAAFDMAVNLQQIEEIDEISKRNITDAKFSYIDTADGLLKNKSQLESLLNPPSTLTPSYQELIKVLTEWEFILRKHIETINKIV